MIIPPAAARRLARNLRGMVAISVTVAVFATLFGAWLALRRCRESDPDDRVSCRGVLLSQSGEPARPRGLTASVRSAPTALASNTS
jgi:hypothetical protein